MKSFRDTKHCTPKFGRLESQVVSTFLERLRSCQALHIDSKSKKPQHAGKHIWAFLTTSHIIVPAATWHTLRSVEVLHVHCLGDCVTELVFIELGTPVHANESVFTGKSRGNERDNLRHVSQNESTGLRKAPIYSFFGRWILAYRTRFQ